VEISKGNPEDFRRQFPQIGERRIVLFLSRIDEKKGIELLLDAFADVHGQAPDTVLVIAGAGSENYLQKLERRAKDLGITNSVIWTGHLHAAIKWAAFASADVFVLPSYSENFGVAAAEALACGLPVVTTNRVGLANEIRAANAGVIVRPKSTEIARALAELSRDSPKRQLFSLNGRKMAEARWSLHYVGVALNNLYREIQSNRAEKRFQEFL
jgi:glycosyltransferase involved in cell wall biosynthesis